MDGVGNVVASNDPASAFVSVETASGLTASITQAVTGGSYFVRVDGVGVATPQTGYSDYGSLGAYALTVSGGVCTAAGRSTRGPAERRGHGQRARQDRGGQLDAPRPTSVAAP